MYHLERRADSLRYQRCGRRDGPSFERLRLHTAYMCLNMRCVEATLTFLVLAVSSALASSGTPVQAREYNKEGSYNRQYLIRICGLHRRVLNALGPQLHPIVL